MSITYEWTTARTAEPTVTREGHLPDGEPIADDDREDYIDEMVTGDYALVLGEGRPLVIEGSGDELLALLARCTTLVERAIEAEQATDWTSAHQTILRLARERDDALDRARAAEARAEDAAREVSTWRTSTESAHSDFLQANYERDEWKARAEKAEARAAADPDACYIQTLPSGDTACIRESHTGRTCRRSSPSR